MVVGETDDDEDDGQEDEAHQLDWFTTNGIDSGDSDPIAGNGTGTDNDETADSVAIEDFVDIVTFGKPDGG